MRALLTVLQLVRAILWLGWLVASLPGWWRSLRDSVDRIEAWWTRRRLDDVGRRFEAAHGGLARRHVVRHREVGSVSIQLTGDWDTLVGHLATTSDLGSVRLGQGSSSIGSGPDHDREALLLAWHGDDGFALETEPTDGRSLETIVSDANTVESAPREEPTVDYLTLPAGRAAKMRTGGGATAPSTEVVRYVVVCGDYAYHLLFASSGLPNDDWLSVAETFRFLPGVE
jgi:hypothetical protein